MKFYLYVLLLLTIIANQSKCQPAHPRGLIKTDDISVIRERIKTLPYNTMYEHIQSTTNDLRETTEKGSRTVYDYVYLASNLAYLYVLSGDTSFARQSVTTSKRIVHEFDYLRNEISRGLTRATIIFHLAIVYDLCYQALTDDERQFLLEVLFKGMLTVSSNMGHSANYALESNWMGVRYATVLFTALVWDETDLEQKRSRALPFIWDAQKRLVDHIDANIYPQGWNAESLGYHGYNWSFIAPAIIALQNNYAHDAFLLQNYAPDAMGSIQALAASSVPIETRKQNYGVKPDFSDDNTNTGMFLYACGQRLYPDEQQPAIKWMFDYFVNTGISSGIRGENFYNIAFDSPATTGKNPIFFNWQHYADTTQGVVVMRNGFKDKNDIVFAFNTTAKRMKGHQGFDNLGIRLIGLDNIWIVGAGRTQEVAGQSTLFPERDIRNMEGDKGAVGDLIEYGFTEYGGFAIGEGSCMHVKDHVRKVWVDYSSQLDFKAVFRINDTSENGKIWRINTPEFNDVKILSDGFLITAPNGSMLRAYITEGPENPIVSIQTVRYGGSTSQHNPGICFHGECFENTKAIDITCDGDISVALVLQESGGTLPSFESVREAGVD